MLVRIILHSWYLSVSKAHFDSIAFVSLRQTSPFRLTKQLCPHQWHHETFIGHLTVIYTKISITELVKGLVWLLLILSIYSNATERTTVLGNTRGYHLLSVNKKRCFIGPKSFSNQTDKSTCSHNWTKLKLLPFCQILALVALTLSVAQENLAKQPLIPDHSSLINLQNWS